MVWAAGCSSDSRVPPIWRFSKFEGAWELAIVSFPMRQGGSGNRCRMRGVRHGAAVTSAFVREDGRRVSRRQEEGLERALHKTTMGKGQLGVVEIVIGQAEKDRIGGGGAK
jgi:hypothetical protein